MGISGTIAGTITEIVFYGVDSYKLMKQAGEQVKPSSLFKGALPIAALGYSASYGIFFMTYNPLRTELTRLFGPGRENLAVLSASMVSAVPAAMVAVPADVIKAQLVLSNSSVPQISSSIRAMGSNVRCALQPPQPQPVVQAARRTISTVVRDLATSPSGVGSFFLGWRVNLLKEVPMAGIEMSLYEGVARAYLRWKHETERRVAMAAALLECCSMNHRTTCDDNSSGSVSEKLAQEQQCRALVSAEIDRITRSRRGLVYGEEPMGYTADDLNGVEAAGAGLVSGICTAVLTCPLDCVYTRIRSGELAQYNVLNAHYEIVRRDGAAALFRGVVPRAAIIGLGATVFWYVQNTVNRVFLAHAAVGAGYN
jgi:hypothetical protein